MIRAARRNWLFAGLLAAGLTLRVLAQFAYQPALVYIDSGRYLSGDGAQDPLGYRALLWPLQRAGGLPAVAAVQHLLGLAMAITLYLVLRRRGLCRWAASLAAAPVLLDGYQLQAEQTIMPDVLFEALIVAGLGCLLAPGRPTARLAGPAGLLFGLAVDVRQAGEALIVVVPALLLACGPGWRRRLACAGLACAGFALPVLGYLTAQYVTAGRFALTERGPDMLYARAAAAADCATLRLPADERSLCPSRQDVAILGIDNMLGEHGGPLLAYQAAPGMKRVMAGRFAVAVLRQQPLTVTLAVAHDFMKLFALTRDRSPGDPPISRWQFQLHYPTYPPAVTRSFVAQLRPGGGPPRADRSLARILRGYQLHGGYTPGPVLLLALLGALASLATRASRPPAGPLGPRAASMLVLAVVLPVLLVSDGYEFSWRYQLPAVILLPAAGALGLAALIARFRAELAAPAAEHIAGPVSADNWPTAGTPAIWRLR